MSENNAGNRDNKKGEKPLAYFKAVVRNSKKNEYRQNENERKYISPTGIWFDGYETTLSGTDDLEQQISIQNAADWLRFIDNERLYTALSGLSQEDIEFLFSFYKNGFTERQMAKHLNVSQATVHKRRKKILNKIKAFF